MTTTHELERVQRAARDLYGKAGTLTRLQGYDDDNYQVQTSTGTFLLKVSSLQADPVSITAQCALMEFIAHCDVPFEVPRIVPTRRGEPWEYVADLQGRPRIVRLLTWVEGTFLAEIPAPSDAVLRSVGRGLAHLDRCLQGFAFPGMDRPFDWDLRQALRLVADLEAIPDARRRALAAAGFARFEEGVLPILRKLPTSIIHNDANEHNILVAHRQDEEVMGGLIDFGDAVRTNTIIEPAVAATYAMMLRDDGQTAASILLAAYHEESPLDDASVAILADLIRTRLCLSVVHSARRTARDGPDVYVTVSEQGAWWWLETMAEDGWKVFANLITRTLRRV